jgi:hypothetical protein
MTLRQLCVKVVEMANQALNEFASSFGLLGVHSLCSHVIAPKKKGRLSAPFVTLQCSA